MSHALTMRILACLDFTTVSDDVVAVARDLARDTAGLLTVMHAAAPEPSFVGYDDAGGPLSRDARETELESEREALGRLVGDLRAQGIAVAEPVLRVGATADTILAVAAEIDADVIVAGRHRHSRLHDLLLGNTATELVRHADRPVLIVPPPPG